MLEEKKIIIIIIIYMIYLKIFNDELFQEFVSRFFKKILIYIHSNGIL
jgi:hypothetical protein